MNKSSIAGMFKGLAMAGLLALITPNTSWADDHMLTVNSGGGVTVSAQTPAVITDSGLVTTPLTFTFTDPPPPSKTTTVTLGTSQTLTVVRALVKRCKPGTRINKGKDPPVFQLEWLDQGNAVVGVTGTLTDGTTSTVPSPNGYRLTLTMTGITDTYASSFGSCTVSGQSTFTYTAGAVLDQRHGATNTFDNKLTSTYNFGMATNTMPEPGTVLLMLTGLLVLGWMSMKSAHAPRRVSA